MHEVSRSRGRRIERAVDLPVLRALIEAKFPNRSELARRIETSPGYLHDIEHGRRNGSVETLEALAEALGVDLEIITSDRDIESVA